MLRSILGHRGKVSWPLAPHLSGRQGHFGFDSRRFAANNNGSRPVRRHLPKSKRGLGLCIWSQHLRYERRCLGNRWGNIGGVEASRADFLRRRLEQWLWDDWSLFAAGVKISSG